MTNLLIVSVIWAFSFGLIRSSLSGIDSSLIACLRLLLASIATLPFIRLNGVTGRLRLELLFIGAVQFGLMYIAYNEAFKSLEAWEVAMLTVTTPLFVIAFDRMLERRMRGVFVIAALTAVSGGCLILWGSPVSEGFYRGLLLVQISNVCFALGQVMYRRRFKSLEAGSGRKLIGLLYLGGFAVTLPMALAASGDLASLGARQIASLAYLGLIASGLCFFLWNQGATMVNSGVLAAFNNAKIPLSVSASILFFGERPSILKLSIGALLIAGGVLFSRAAPVRGSRSGSA